MALSATEQLLAFEQIKQLKAKYCRYIDTKRWELLGTLFAADTVFDGFGSAPSGADVATFVAGVSKRLQPCISVHHCHTPDISLLSDTHARGIWAM
ncbi:MAG: nuclear transport factor 2 family protein, partial [Janthinobacterium lividum]